VTSPSASVAPRADAAPIMGKSSPKQRSAHVARIVPIVVLLLVALCSIGIIALMVGVTRIAPEEVLRIILTGEGERVPRLVVTQVRLPRLVLGMLCGAALAVAGAMLQDALRNELAEPNLLGVSTGASLVVAFVVVFNIAVPFGAMPFLALIGGLTVGLIILFATRLTRNAVRMILIGASLSALFGALITAIVVLGEPNEIRSLYTYLVGSLIGRNWDDVRLVAPWIIIGLPAALLFGRALNLLQLGDDMAEGLGLPVFRTRAAIFFVAIALQAAVVATCGPVGFIALLSPHMVRAMLGTTDARQVLPIAALVGALLLATADLLAREILSPAEMPVGLLTIAIGSPFALFLLRRVITQRVES
jgi:iron complex transport system permease protein